MLQAQGPRCWSALARQMPTKDGKRRSGKSCRLRWCNQLDPAVNKAQFSQWEMAVIIRAQAVRPASGALIGRAWPQPLRAPHLAVYPRRVRLRDGGSWRRSMATAGPR